MQNKTYWTTKPPLQTPPSTSKATTPKAAPSQKKKQNNSHAKAAASERSVREYQEAGIQFENIAHNRQALATLTAEQEKWRNPALHPELRQEAYEEFKKTAEGAQDYFNFGSFSLRTKQEMQNVHNCIKGLTSDSKIGILHNRTYGDFTLAMGRKGKKGYGALHMHERRLQEGFTDDEAAFILVTALKAAESERYSEKKGNKMLFDRLGVRTVVAENPNGSKPIVTGFVLVSAGDESHAALPHTNFYALDELGSVQLVGASAQRALALFDKIVNDNPTNWEQIISATIEELKRKQTVFKRGESYNGSPLDAFSQQETSVSTLSLRRRVDRNINSLLNERETTLARVSNYIKREADRTANIMGRDTELQRAGVAFTQANAIINALDTYIFSKEIIRKNTAEYRRLRDLRHFINEYITVARKGKLPVRSNTIKAAIRERLETQLSAARETAAHTSQNRRAAITSYREQGREYQYEAAYMAMPLMMKPQRLRQ